MTIKPWIALWKSDLLSSDNYQVLSIAEKGIYNQLLLHVRDDEYIGQFVFPNGNKMTIDDIIATLNPKKGDRVDRIKAHIERMLHIGLLFYNKAGCLEIRKYAEKTSLHSPLPPANLPPTSEKSDLPNHLINNKLGKNKENLLHNSHIHSHNHSQINNKDKDMVYASILTHWNNQNIITHRKLTDKMKRSINGRLDEGNTLDDILTAITNYGKVLKDARIYWWTHKWTMIDFLNRGFDKFKDWDIVSHNYKRDNKDVKHNDFQANKRPDGYFDKGKRETAPATGENKEG